MVNLILRATTAIRQTLLRRLQLPQWLARSKARHHTPDISRMRRPTSQNTCKDITDLEREKNRARRWKIYKKPLSLFIITIKYNNPGTAHHQPSIGTTQVKHQARQWNTDNEDEGPYPASRPQHDETDTMSLTKDVTNKECVNWNYSFIKQIS